MGRVYVHQQPNRFFMYFAESEMMRTAITDFNGLVYVVRQKIMKFLIFFQ